MIENFSGWERRKKVVQIFTRNISRAKTYSGGHFLKMGMSGHSVNDMLESSQNSGTVETQDGSWKEVEKVPEVSREKSSTVARFV